MNCRGWDHLSQYSYTNTDILNPSHDKLSKYFYLLNHGQHADLAGLNDIKVLRDCENVQVWSRLLNKIIYCTCSDLLWWTRNCHQRFLLSAVSGVNLINTINNVHTSCLQCSAPRVRGKSQAPLIQAQLLQTMKEWRLKTLFMMAAECRKVML